MSYDFDLFPCSIHIETLEDIHAFLESEADTDRPTPFDAAKEKQKSEVAKRLIEENPKLEWVQFDYEEIAKLENCSLHQAKIRYRHIELNTPEDGNGIQITLFDSSASLTIPYWHQNQAAMNGFKEIWTYLTIMSGVGGMRIYDPQLDQIIDLDKDFDLVLGTYCGVSEKIPEMKEHLKQKPWWQFW